jgi:translation initiation factor IF-2
MKVFELAKELDTKALDLIEKIKPLNLTVKNHMSELSDEQVTRIKDFYTQASAPAGAAASGGATVVRKRKAASDTAKPSAKSSVVIKRKKESDEVKEESQVAAEPEGVETPAPETVAPSIQAEAEVSAKTEEATTEQPAVQAAPPVQEEAHPKKVLHPRKEEVAPPPAVKPKRFSFIRVAESTPEELAVRRPVIIEDVVSEEVKTEFADVKARKKEDDDHVSVERSAADILRELEKDEAQGRRKGGFSSKESAPSADFRSTDYLRRERVYQIRKKKLTFGRTSSKVSTVAAKRRFVEFGNQMSVEELAEELSLKVREVAMKLDALGIERPDEAETFADWILDLETVQVIAAEFGFEVKDRSVTEDSLVEFDEEYEQQTRPPVVTIMGHVDHGKTSLLDFIRKSRVVDREAGGITQHIGAYTVKVSDAIKNITAAFEAHASAGEAKKTKGAKAEGGKSDAKTKAIAKAAATKTGKVKGKAGEKVAGAIIPEITFLDTPGHAAFSSMRARGAQVTDIVILVVAASEGLMPQTREAIDHAKAAGVPVIVAVNKMDLPDANPDKVLQQLSEVGILSEEWGGETLVARISAKTGLGVADLLEKIQLQAEILELTARKEGPATGIIIEAHLDKGRGSVATTLVKEGTLKVGDYVVVGTQSSKVRALIDDQGKNIREGGPSMPVLILGLTDVPEAGDPLNVVEDEKKAKELVELRRSQNAEESSGRKMSLEEMMRAMNQGELKELPIILKGDVKGSVEAINGALAKLPANKVKLKVLSTAVGGISENDVLLANASRAIVVGFNVRPDAKTISEAERLGVEIKTYTIIYNLLDDIVKAMEGMLAPTLKEEVLGQAEVRNVFSLSKAGTVAGSFVISGKIARGSRLRVIRQGRVVYTGALSGLKRFKDDAKEVAQGYECGISIENFNDVKEGDILECFKETEHATKLEGPAAN